MKPAPKGNASGSQWLAGCRNFFTLMKLAYHRLRSEEDYRAFQAYQALLIIEYLKKWGVWREGQLVLDLGSGIGGYSQQMVEQGARVLSVDRVIVGPRFGTLHAPVVADALYIPIRNETVDLVFCASLIEHVSDPLKLLNEIQRVLRTGGYCYLSFPPFYSPRGGHEFSPFHYLGERLAIHLTCTWREHPEWVNQVYQPNADPRSFSETWQKITIKRARRLIVLTGLRIIDISTRYSPVNTAKWPLIGELLTWHVQFILMKSGEQA